MNSAIPEKVSEETPSALDSALIAEKETNAQRLLSFIARLTSNSTDELDKAIAELERLQDLESEPGHGRPNSSGSFAMFTAIRRASSFVSSLAADRRSGSSSKYIKASFWPVFDDKTGLQFLDRPGRREATEGMARRSWYYRVAVKLIFVIFGILGASAAQAQNAPWCLQTSSLGGYQSCTYATFEQCLVDRAAKNGFCTQNSTMR